MDPDFSVLERWRAGDRAAGKELFGRHFPAIARFFRNKSGDAYEDLVQRTFLACVESQAHFEGHSTFRAFLFGIARNILREHYKALTKHARVDALDDLSLHDLAPRASTLLAEHAEEELLLQALRRLTIDEQVLLELRFWEELRIREIAEVLEIPGGTVATRLRRVRHKLNGWIERLSDDPGLHERTLSGLQTWAQNLRERMGGTDEG